MQQRGCEPWVLVAAFDSQLQAERAYSAIRALYPHDRNAADFDAAIIAIYHGQGSPTLVRYSAQGRADGVGLAVGAARVIRPDLAIAGRDPEEGDEEDGSVVTRHVRAGLSKADLRMLGDVLEAGEAALVSVHPAIMLGEIEQAVELATRVAATEVDIDMAELTRESQAADGLPLGHRPGYHRRQQGHELRTADGRVFRVGAAVLYHASTEPEHPLLEARVDAIVEGADGEPVLVLRLDDDGGTRLPDALGVHLDARPLAGCPWCVPRVGGTADQTPSRVAR